MNDQYEAQIREFLSRDIVFLSDDSRYGDETSLLEQGIMDSMGVLEIVTFLQSTYGISVELFEVTSDNFDSVRKLAAYVRRKRLPQSECRDVSTTIPGD